MTPKQHDVFLLGEEALDTDTTIERHAVEGGEPAPRNPFAAVPEQPTETVSVPSRSRRFPRRLAAGGLLAVAGTLLAVVALRGGGRSQPRQEVNASSLPPVEMVHDAAPSPRIQSPVRIRRPELVGSALAADKPSQRRPTDSAEREPTSEQAPVSPPVDEPAPAPEAQPVPVSPPQPPSPSRPLRDGSGPRPEFSFER